MEAAQSRRRGSIATSSAIVMGGFLASKAIGIVRQSIIAATFGASGELDAYYAAFKLPDLLLTLVAGGAIATTFIPVFAEHLARGDRERAWRLASAVLNALLLLMGSLALLAALLAPWLVERLIAPGLSPAGQRLTADLLRIVLLSSILFAASSLVMSVLQAHERFLLPALADFFYDVGIIGGALFLAPRQGIYGLAWGVVAGAGLHILIQVPGLVHLRARYAPTLDVHDESLLQIVRLTGPRILILGMFQLVFLFTTNLASHYAEGSITAINMGWTMMQMPEVIFAMAIATAAFPRMSRLFARGQVTELGETVLAALRATLFLVLPSALALLLLGRSYIAVLFGRGAFGEQAVDIVYGATAAYTVGLVGHSVLELAARTFYAHKNTVIPFWVAVGATALNVTLCLLLGPSLGGAGLALANSIAVTLQSGALLWLAWRLRVRFDWRPIWGLCWRAGLALAGMAGSIWLAAQFVRGRGDLWVAALGSAAGSGVYLGLMALLHQSEARKLAHLAREWAGI
ncbi:MAG: murein biosynthesis integral membrane protein MurJ [Anaerolineae bacterium]